jgi:hypothetical protein
VFSTININNYNIGIRTSILDDGVFGGFVDGILEFDFLPSWWVDAFFGVGGGIIG